VVSIGTETAGRETAVLLIERRRGVGVINETRRRIKRGCYHYRWVAGTTTTTTITTTTTTAAAAAFKRATTTCYYHHCSCSYYPRHASHHPGSEEEETGTPQLLQFM